ncbi:Uncharacterised protein [Clostridium perfringens]|uniref:Uncharacterized protein n=1 Tax=Clostridium perfringens TaxID=1502 RepID=A0A2X3IQP2_CLOPF|nr:hypothetical protein [Clostridium perfringens]SQC85444.1 Uncharacterised protein [Clostridium perfringens]
MLDLIKIGLLLLAFPILICLAIILGFTLLFITIRVITFIFDKIFGDCECCCSEEKEEF